jgi:hypothetical protein
MAVVQFHVVTGADSGPGEPAQRAVSISSAGDGHAPGHKCQAGGRGTDGLMDLLGEHR